MRYVPVPPRRLPAILAAVLAASIGAKLTAEDRPETVKLELKDIHAASVFVPKDDRPSVLLFARIDHEQSRRAIASVRAAAKDLSAIQVVVILSGEDENEASRKKFAETIPSWSVVSDPDYAIVGQLRIRVWPTSVVISAKGEESARLTGTPPTYGRDLGVHLAYVAGKIDRKTRDARLQTTTVVVSGPEQMALRHLRVGERLLEKGLVDHAMAEVDKGLKLAPNEGRLLLAKARLLLLQGEPSLAMSLLDGPAKSVRGPQIAIIRGGALVTMKKWDRAITVLEAAVQLNPDPAEGYYFLALAYQARGKLAEAAKAFRSAFESTRIGRQISVSIRPATPPATAPAKPKP